MIEDLIFIFNRDKKCEKDFGDETPEMSKNDTRGHLETFFWKTCEVFKLFYGKQVVVSKIGKFGEFFTNLEKIFKEILKFFKNLWKFLKTF